MIRELGAVLGLDAIKTETYLKHWKRAIWFPLVPNSLGSKFTEFARLTHRPNLCHISEDKLREEFIDQFRSIVEASVSSIQDTMLNRLAE